MVGAPKKKGALAALLSFGGKSSDPPEEEDGSRYSKGEEPEEDMEEPELDAKGAAFAAFAKAAGIPEERRASANEALTRFVKACSATEYDEEDEEE